MRKFTVTTKAMRPASRKEVCFYCQEPVGEVHKDECALIRKSTKVRFSFELPIPLPAHWHKENVEFFYNEGSWCAHNIIALLKEHMEQHKSCLCDIVEAEFISNDSEEYLRE